MPLTRSRPRILVTGGRGFIASHVPAFLGDGADILACGRKECDLLDPAAVRALLDAFRPTHCLHCAWITRGDYARDPANAAWLHAGIGLIREFYARGGRRFVGVGTCIEYAPVAELRSETRTPTVPDTPYGRCKLALGQVLAACAEAAGRSWAWCRPFHVTGPGEAPHRLVPSACAAFLRGEPFRVASPDSVLDYMDVRDVAGALARILLSDWCGHVNIAGGAGVRLGDMIARLAELAGADAPACSRNGGGRPAVVVGDAAILRDVIGFAPGRSLDATLRDCLEDTRRRAHEVRSH